MYRKHTLALYTSISGRRAAIHAMHNSRNNNNNDRNKREGGLARFKLVSDGMTVILVTLSPFFFVLFRLRPDKAVSYSFFYRKGEEDSSISLLFFNTGNEEMTTIVTDICKSTHMHINTHGTESADS
jgi:hypothetical protein